MTRKHWSPKRKSRGAAFANTALAADMTFAGIIPRFGSCCPKKPILFPQSRTGRNF